VSEENVHPPNQMRVQAELQVNYNSAFGLSASVPCGGWIAIRTSTSKLFFLARLSVIFADFASNGVRWEASNLERSFTIWVYSAQAAQIEYLE